MNSEYEEDSWSGSTGEPILMTFIVLVLGGLLALLLTGDGWGWLVVIVILGSPIIAISFVLFWPDKQSRDEHETEE